ncbi:MAG: DUF1801 domain-containing protein [Bacteroidetes bacterium]|nr:DUF1801 domain-containing protein [Bacteroidota bacterium]
METIELKSDLHLITVRAERFPEGIQEAFDELRKRLPAGDGRMPYGISKPEKDGTIIYRAGVEAATEGEGSAEGLERVTLRSGTYATVTVSDWQNKIHSLSGIFDGLLQHPQLDPATPCIEVYKSRSELVCMVRMTGNATKIKRKDDRMTVSAFLASIKDEQTRKESRALIGIMKRISGKRPKLWNAGTIGFDSYHYRYDSGREGDCQVIGFYPRKGKITIYLMDGTARYATLLKKLGTHSTSRVCLYIKHLRDIQLPVLEQILQQSYTHIKSMDGQMQRVL